MTSEEAVARAIADLCEQGTQAHGDEFYGPILDHLASLSAMPAQGWRDIAEIPQSGTVAVLYFPKHAHDGFLNLDYRYRLCLYRSDDPRWAGWIDQGTGHDSFEGADLTGNDKATHWQPLPAQPEET